MWRLFRRFCSLLLLCFEKAVDCDCGIFLVALSIFSSVYLIKPVSISPNYILSTMVHSSVNGLRQYESFCWDASVAAQLM